MRRILVLTALFALVFAGCRSSKPAITKFYVLEYPSGKAEFLPDTLLPFSVSMEIMPVEVYPAFATHRIAIREDSHELSYFSHHEWAVRPGEALTLFVSDFFTQNRIISKVSTRFWDTDPEFRLRTSIFQLEVLQEKGRFFARIHIDLRLEDAKQQIFLTQHQADLRLELPRRNLNLFADEISLIFFDELKVFTEKLIPVLLNHTVSSAGHD
jgi:ABC-type uncharacterized transport system auxiliary subunit